ncbi:MAG TPA: hypothetical protein VGW14_04445 [Thermoleophilaceae bacterium]|nr:hypothetical protein [Thermoleophilaceae bacterium]
MGSRSRRRARRGEQAPAAPAATTDHRDDEGGVLTLRDDLSAGTLRELADLDAKPAASAEDRSQRRVEFLFERLAVRWEIAGLPLEGQKELLGRYRMASSGERRRVRTILAEHLAAKHPEIDL